LASELHGTVWQKCRTYFMRNMLTKVAESIQSLATTLVRSIFAPPDAKN
jgi:transposase-like protein